VGIQGEESAGKNGLSSDTVIDQVDDLLGGVDALGPGVLEGRQVLIVQIKQVHQEMVVVQMSLCHCSKALIIKLYAFE
jgi:hypothetical protein